MLENIATPLQNYLSVWFS